MFNYVQAELYRIFSKRGMYIFFGVLLLLVVVFLVMMRNTYTADSVGEFVGMILAFLMLVGGGYLFGTIYNDDLSAKTLPSLLGFGRKRAFIVIGKLIVTVIMLTGLFVIGSAILFGLMGLLAGGITSTSFQAGLTMTVLYWLSAIGYFAISAVVVYGTQKTTLSIVTFVLMGTGFIEQLLDIPFSRLKESTGLDLMPYKIMNLGMSIAADHKYWDILPYIVVVGLFVGLTILAFHKKDLEF